MKGTNTIMKQEMGDGQRLWIQEIMGTIQGEGPFAGRPSIFVRLRGCNLRCFWCDTDFESVKWRPSIDEIITNILSHTKTVDTRLVVITGGEPLRQNIAPLIETLFDKYGFEVQIETSGSLWLDELARLKESYSEKLTIVCSPKTGRVKQEVEKYADAWKYIIRSNEIDENDGLPIFSTQIPGRAQRLSRPPKSANNIYVQPMDEYDDAKNISNMNTASSVSMKHGYRLCLQIHKMIGLP